MASPTIPLASLWVSPFRPFCVLGVAYGVALMAAWIVLRLGVFAGTAGSPVTQGWHGHEMLYGFAGAIVCAIALTALPGWAGTREIRGAPLAGLVALWIVARMAFWWRDALPTWLAVAGVVTLWVVLAAILAWQLARAARRACLWIIVVLGAMVAGDALFMIGDAATGILMGVYALLLLYALVGGVFTPVFTGNHLRATGRGEQPPSVKSLDAASIGAIVVLAFVDLSGAPLAWRAAAAFAACALNGARLWRWQGWRVLDAPLLWTLHAGYAWMVVALALLALGDLGSTGAARAWLHAFTVGALGSAMIGLMTRVALRHTGRPLTPSPAVVAAHLLVQAAALARVGAAFADGDTAWVVAAGSAWLAAFAIYLANFGPILVRPSLPRIVAGPLDADPPTMTTHFPDRS
ncbi:MAG: NnrS family protein [Burkholderiales bacterium]|nr:NnrS family protein [Burkholderiales bacterium]